jgi:hypothetical protein
LRMIRFHRMVIFKKWCQECDTNKMWNKQNSLIWLAKSKLYKHFGTYLLTKLSLHLPYNLQLQS